jgi:hypothetical protein
LSWRIECLLLPACQSYLALLSLSSAFEVVSCSDTQASLSCKLARGKAKVEKLCVSADEHTCVA